MSSTLTTVTIFSSCLRTCSRMPVVAHDHDRDPRQVRVLGLADREAVDVEPARGEHARDVRQDARLVLHQRREDVADPARALWRRLSLGLCAALRSHHHPPPTSSRHSRGVIPTQPKHYCNGLIGASWPRTHLPRITEAARQTSCRCIGFAAWLVSRPAALRGPYLRFASSSPKHRSRKTLCADASAESGRQLGEQRRSDLDGDKAASVRALRLAPRGLQPAPICLATCLGQEVSALTALAHSNTISRCESNRYAECPRAHVQDAQG